MSLLIGIDVGGTNLRLGVVKSSAGVLQLLEEIRFRADFSAMCKSHSPTQAWQHIINTTAEAIRNVREQYPDVAAVGIGFPGFIDPQTQKIAQSPNLPGLNDVDLNADLSQLINLPVVVENDALAAAYGEYANQYCAQNTNLIYIGLGTGVGGGLILNGQPFQGDHGVAMEVGHIIVQPYGRFCGCGNAGCMEQYASAGGVAKTYFEATNKNCHASEIATMAGQGNQAALDAYALAGKSLAQALAHTLKVIDVKKIVIGGGMSASWDLMQKAFNLQLQQDLIPVLRNQVAISVSSMGDQAGIIGAAMLAQQKTRVIS
ncbi:MAG: glucokinase [Methylotenera sp.]|nr:MAG: glucokinase [Methylotenera sp.]